MRPPRSTTRVNSTTPVDATAAADAAVAAARRRIARHSLLPHAQRRWEAVAGALKRAQTYDLVIAVPRRDSESLQAYTRRWAFVFQTERRRVLLINLDSELYDGTQRDNCHAVGLPHLCASVLLGRVGLARIVGAPDGVARVAEALRAAGVPYATQTP